MNGGRWLLIGQPVAERARVPGGGRPSRIENGRLQTKALPGFHQPLSSLPPQQVDDKATQRFTSPAKMDQVGW